MRTTTSTRIRTATGYVVLMASLLTAAPAAASTARADDEVALRARVSHVESYGSLGEPGTDATEDVVLRARVTHLESYARSHTASVTYRTAPMTARVSDPEAYGAPRRDDAARDAVIQARVTHAGSYAELRVSPHDVALRARVSEPAAYAALRSAGRPVASSDIEEPAASAHVSHASDAGAPSTELGVVAALTFVAIAAFAVLRSARLKPTA